jgi:hypothetical protein
MLFVLSIFGGVEHLRARIIMLVVRVSRRTVFGLSADGLHSPSNRASRAIWAPGRACSAVRGDSRRTTFWLALAMPPKPWAGLRWKIEPFPSFSPFHYPPIHSRTVTACFKRSFEIQTLVYDQRMNDECGTYGKKMAAAARPTMQQLH